MIKIIGRPMGEDGIRRPRRDAKLLKVQISNNKNI